jgi:hypothetical protein
VIVSAAAETPASMMPTAKAARWKVRNVMASTAPVAILPGGNIGMAAYP